MKTKDLVEMLEHFGYVKVKVAGSHNLFIHNKKKNSRVIFAPLASTRIVPELTLVNIKHTIIYNGVATANAVDEYVAEIEQRGGAWVLVHKKSPNTHGSRSGFSKKTSAVRIAAKKKR